MSARAGRKNGRKLQRIVLTSGLSPFRGPVAPQTHEDRIAFREAEAIEVNDTPFDAPGRSVLLTQRGVSQKRTSGCNHCKPQAQAARAARRRRSWVPLGH